MFWKFDIGVVLHEMLHILVMSNSLFPYFWDRDINQFFSEEDVLAKASDTGLANDYIVTEIVQSVECLLCSFLLLEMDDLVPLVQHLVMRCCDDCR